jgi:hypothetical protein
MEVILHPSHRKIHITIFTRQLSHVNCKNSERKLTWSEVPRGAVILQQSTSAAEYERINGVSGQD